MLRIVICLYSNYGIDFILILYLGEKMGSSY
jgi:hypothetical protein